MKLPPKRDKTPVLIGVRSKLGGQLHCWCPYCRKFHHHGNSEGHRVAHCYVGNTDSSFMQTGYYIADGTKQLAKMVREAAK